MEVFLSPWGVVFFVAMAIMQLKIYYHWKHLQNEDHKLKRFPTFYHYQLSLSDKHNSILEHMMFTLALIFPYFLFDKKQVLHPLNIASFIYLLSLLFLFSFGYLYGLIVNN